MEKFFGNFFEWGELVNAGVVDQDVDFAEDFLGFLKETGDVGLF